MQIKGENKERILQLKLHLFSRRKKKSETAHSLAQKSQFSTMVVAIRD